MITISIALLTNCERFKGKSLCKIIHIENDIGKIKARLSIYAGKSQSMGVGDTVLIFGGVSRYCTWVLYFKDYYAAIHILSKKGR